MHIPTAARSLHRKEAWEEKYGHQWLSLGRESWWLEERYKMQLLFSANPRLPFRFLKHACILYSKNKIEIISAARVAQRFPELPLCSLITLPALNSGKASLDTLAVLSKYFMNGQVGCLLVFRGKRHSGTLISMDLLIPLLAQALCSDTRL